MRRLIEWVRLHGEVYNGAQQDADAIIRWFRDAEPEIGSRLESSMLASDALEVARLPLSTER